MQPLMLLVADHASVEPNTGKLNVLGAFRQIIASNFPLQYSRFSIVIKLGGEVGEIQRECTLTVILTNEDGKEILQFSAPFTMPVAHQTGMQPELNAVVELNNVVFPHPGEYQVSVFVDDQVISNTAIILTLKTTQE